MKLTDELLLKYADNELDEGARTQIDLLLQTDVVAAQRLRLIQFSGAALRREAETVGTSQENDALAKGILDGSLQSLSTQQTVNMASRASDQAAHKTSMRWGGWQIAASIVVLGLGLAGGYIVGRAAGPQTIADLQAYPVWVVRVVDYHTLYDRETVAPSRTRSDQIKGLETRFSGVLGRKVIIPDLESDQLEFRRGQFLKFEDDPIIQLAYLPHKTGRPVALCLKATNGADSKPLFGALNGLGMVRWRQNGLEYILVGDRSEKQLRNAADAARSQISKV